MDHLAAAILITWKRNGAYALNLVADLAPQQWTAQPVPGRVLNHPAWVFCHLNVYTPIAACLAAGRPFADPIDHPHGQKSEAGPGPYPPGETLRAEFARLHEEAAAALAVAEPVVLRSPNPLERWRGVHPTVGDMLVTLMVKHESGHLGQLSAWRRALGLPRVAMG